MEDKNYKGWREDPKYKGIVPPEDPMTPEELARIKLPLNYETYLYLCDAGYTINNYDSLPEPMRSQWRELEDKECKKIGMSHWD